MLGHISIVNCRPELSKPIRHQPSVHSTTIEARQHTLSQNQGKSICACIFAGEQRQAANLEHPLRLRIPRAETSHQEVSGIMIVKSAGRAAQRGQRGDLGGAGQRCGHSRRRQGHCQSQRISNQEVPHSMLCHCCLPDDYPPHPNTHTPSLQITPQQHRILLFKSCGEQSLYCLDEAQSPTMRWSIGTKP